jgi:poly(A) polymerase Pap1
VYLAGAALGVSSVVWPFRFHSLLAANTCGIGATVVVPVLASALFRRSWTCFRKVAQNRLVLASVLGYFGAVLLMFVATGATH